MLLRNWSSLFDRLLLLAPDVGDGGGGGDPNDDKKFTQAELEKHIEDRLKKAKREALEKDKKLSDLASELETLKAKIDALPPEPTDGDKKQKGEHELLVKRFEKQLSELTAKLENSEKEKQTERQRRMLTERDKELGDALQAVGCVDMKGGRRHFEPDIVWDDVENKWMFKTRTGNLVSIVDGVTDEMPTYLKPSTITSGGSGSGGSTPKRLAKKNELEAAKAKLKELEAAAAQSRGNSALVAQCNVQRKLIKKLEAELTT